MNMGEPSFSGRILGGRYLLGERLGLFGAFQKAKLQPMPGGGEGAPLSARTRDNP